MNRIIKTIATFLAVLTAFTVLSVMSFATNESISLKELYNNPNGRTMCASEKGYWKEAPENSLKSVQLAAQKGADIVKIDVKKTSDNVLILMADETVTRTCYGYSDKTKVSEMTFKEISELSLLMGEGGSLAEKTADKIPTLENIFNSDTPCLYLVDASWNLRDEVYSLAEKCKVLDSVIFLFGDAKPDEVSEWKSTVSTEPMTMTYFKGNVIFSATSFVTKSAEAGVESVYLATKVPYGVVFGETVMEKVNGNIRAMANTSEASLCGKVREDTEVWWDDLISRGYSIILTDYVPELKEYINECAKKQAELKEVYDKLVTGWTLPDLKSDKFLDCKRLYNNAAVLSASLINDDSCSRSKLSTAMYELQKTYDDINNNYESLKNGTAGLTITPVRIIICLIAVVAVITAEIFVYKKKRTNKL